MIYRVALPVLVMFPRVPVQRVIRVPHQHVPAPVIHVAMMQVILTVRGTNRLRITPRRPKNG